MTSLVPRRPTNLDCVCLDFKVQTGANVSFSFGFKKINRPVKVLQIKLSHSGSCKMEADQLSVLFESSFSVSSGSIIIFPFQCLWFTYAKKHVGNPAHTAGQHTTENPECSLMSLWIPASMNSVIFYRWRWRKAPCFPVAISSLGCLTSRPWCSIAAGDKRWC